MLSYCENVPRMCEPPPPLYLIEISANEVHDVFCSRVLKVNVDHEDVVCHGVRRVDAGEIYVVDEFG